MARSTWTRIGTAAIVAAALGLSAARARGGEPSLLAAADGAAGDGFGRAVATDRGTTVVGAPSRDQGATDAGTAYVFVACGGFLPQQAELRPSDPQSFANFGASVAIDGDTAVVGAPGASSGGAAYVFRRTRGAWAEQQKLAGPGGTARFGASVAIDGDRIVVGAPATAGGNPFTPSTGAVWVYERSGAAWTSVATLGGDDVGGEFGASVALEGDRFVAGAPTARGTLGTATTFTRSAAGAWTREIRLAPADAAAGDEVGSSVALDGGRIALGAPGTNAGGMGDSGTVHTYRLGATGWERTGSVALQVPVGGEIFGASVALDGAALVVGAPGDDTGGADAGIVELFLAGPDGWTRTAPVAVPVPAAGDAFGTAVALGGGRVFGGTPGRGAGVVFALSVVAEQKLTAADGAAEDRFGWSVAADGDTAIVGVPYDDGAGGDAGAAYVFVREGPVWTERQVLRAPDGEGGDTFGTAVAISGDHAVVGAPRDLVDGPRTGSAHVFTRRLGFWEHHAKLRPSVGRADGFFGNAVAISGGRAVVGAAAAEDAYVFAETGGAWSQEARLTPPSGTPVQSQFGASVAIDGSTVVVGSPLDRADGPPVVGAVHVFSRYGTAWSRRERLVAPAAAGDGSLGTTVALSGDTLLAARSTFDPASPGEVVVFRRTDGSWGESQTLAASDGAAGDGFGTAIAVSGDLAVIGADRAAAGAAYVFARTGAGWAERLRLAAPGGEAGDEFGRGVVLAGETVLAGAVGDDDRGADAGAVHAVALEVPAWLPPAKTTAADGAPDDRFGNALALSGNTIVVGAATADGNAFESGTAYVLVRSGAGWALEQELTAPDVAPGDRFGGAVAIDGDTAVVGAPQNSLSLGAAYVFVRSGTTWTLQQKLTASDGTRSYGGSVAIRGDTLLVGAVADASFTGSAFVHVRSGTTWTEQRKLTASDGAATDYFGQSVALDGETALVGAPQHDSLTGAAYVFVRSGSTWTEQRKLTAADGVVSDQFGFSVALSGDTALVGARRGASGSGAAYVFVRSGTSWTQAQRLVAPDGVSGDSFGIRVALAGDTAAVGANADANGSAYVFRRTGAAWAIEQKLAAPDGEPTDSFGSVVAIDGSTAVVSAPFDDDRGAEAGAVYSFERRPREMTLTPPAATLWTVDRPYDGALAATGGTAPHQWRVTAGSLPAGLALDPATGAVAGTPTATGASAAVVECTDACGETAEVDVAITIVAPPEIVLPQTFARGVLGRTYLQFALSPTGTPPFTWSLDDGGCGLSVDQFGTVSGTTATLGYFTLVLHCTDATGATAAPLALWLTVVEPFPLPQGSAKLGVSADGGEWERSLELLGSTALSVSAKVKKGFAPPTIEVYDEQDDAVPLGAALKTTATGFKLRKLVVPRTGRYTVRIVPGATDPAALVSVSISVAAPRTIARTLSLGAALQRFVVPALAGSKVAVTISAVKGAAVDPHIESVYAPALSGPVPVTPKDSRRRSTVSIASAPGGEFYVYVGTNGGTSGDAAAKAAIRPPKGYVFALTTAAGGYTE